MEGFKNNKNRKHKKGLAFFILFFVFALGIHFVLGATADELQQKIDDRAQAIAALEKEIASYQVQLKDIGDQKQSLSQAIKELDVTTKKLLDEIKLSEKKISAKNDEIKDLSGQITDKGKHIDSNREAIAESIRFNNLIDNDSFVVQMLSEQEISESWRDVDKAVQFQKSIREKIIETQTIKAELEDTKTATEKAKADLVALNNKLKDQKKIVDATSAEKNKLLKETKNQEANYQKLLAANLAKKDSFEKELRDYESQLQYVLNPSLLPKAGSGPLSWPLDSVRITQLFGKTSSSGRLYASGTHNGVDFGTSIGTPVKAMANGVVDGTGDTDVQCPGVSFGRFILIKYDNGLASTYGHLSLIRVQKGDSVTRGQVVGYSGNTGYSTGPHLHVSVYARDAVNLKTLPSLSCPGHVLTQPIAAINGYLDPMLYLPTK